MTEKSVCRACLVELNVPEQVKFSIFDEDLLFKKFTEITRISVKADDELPKNICEKCFNSLSAAYDFQNVAQQSDVFLKLKNEKVEQMNEEYLEDAYGLPESEEEDEKSDADPFNLKCKCFHCGKLFKTKHSLKIHARLHTGHLLKYCEICGAGFQKQFQLDRHIRSKHNPKIHIYKCTKCNSRFESREELKNHGEIHKISFKKQFNCKICDATHDSRAALKAHLDTHQDPKTMEAIELNQKFHGEGGELSALIAEKIKSGDFSSLYQILSADCREKNLSDTDSDDEAEEVSLSHLDVFSCTKCNLKFRNCSTIMAHMRNEHDMMIFDDKCHHCGLQFPCKSILERHLRQQCENQMKVFKCPTCNVRFQWEESLKIHNQFIHSQDKQRKHACHECEKTFIRAEHLERHKKIHNPQEKKFECPKCQKKFNRKDNLKSHMKIHEPKSEQISQAYLCVHCGRAFQSSSNLIVHVRRHTGEKPHKCDVPDCNKAFPRKSDLKCHLRTHTGEKPNLCNLCGKSFSRSNKLLRHMRIHLGVRPYQCTYCDRKFTQSNDLTLHIRRHTGEKPFACGGCDERFIQGTALRAHLRFTGHPESASNPNSYKVVSVNNPNRLLHQSNKIPEGNITIRPVARRTKNMNKQTIASPIENIDIPRINVTVLMSNEPNLLQISSLEAS